MTWKKEWDKQVIDELWDKPTIVGTQRLSITQQEIILGFIRNEIIEKLIEECSPNLEQYTGTDELKQQLRDKWL